MYINFIQVKKKIGRPFGRQCQFDGKRIIFEENVHVPLDFRILKLFCLTH